MALDIKSVEYYNLTVQGHVVQGSKALSVFANIGISWFAFKAVPVEPMCTRFTLFPNDSRKMTEGAKQAGLELDGPHSALLIQGEDESGALADIYEKLSRAGIDVTEASGIADIKGGYGVVLYLKQEDCEKAVAALEI